MSPFPAPVGGRVMRTEDPRLLTGNGRYVGDLRLPDMVYAAFVRAPSAPARIVALRVDDAVSMDGVAAVFTADDLPALARGRERPAHSPGVGGREMRAAPTDPDSRGREGVADGVEASRRHREVTWPGHGVSVLNGSLPVPIADVPLSLLHVRVVAPVDLVGVSIVRDRTVDRPIRLQHHVVRVAESPILAGFKTADDVMLAVMGMPGRMPVRRAITTADVAAHHAQSQVHPPVPRLEAILAAIGTRRHRLHLGHM